MFVGVDACGPKTEGEFPKTEVDGVAPKGVLLVVLGPNKEGVPVFAVAPKIFPVVPKGEGAPNGLAVLPNGVAPKGLVELAPKGEVAPKGLGLEDCTKLPDACSVRAKGFGEDAATKGLAVCCCCWKRLLSNTDKIPAAFWL